MADLRKENVAEDIKERHYLIMPFNNKWYKLKMEFDIVNTNIQERCESVYGRVCSDYSNQNIAIMEIETGKTFVFNSQHDEVGNLQKITCNDFSQFESLN